MSDRFKAIQACQNGYWAENWKMECRYRPAKNLNKKKKKNSAGCNLCPNLLYY